MTKRVGTDFDSVRDTKESKLLPGDQVDIYKFPNKKWVTVRCIGMIFPYAEYWVSTKKKDGTRTSFSVACPSFDPATQERDSTIYDPWRDVIQVLRSQHEDDKNYHCPVRFSTFYFGNAIIRGLQRQLPERMPRPTKEELASGFKDRDSESVTPVRAIRIPRSLANKIKKQSQLNVHTSSGGAEKAFPVGHPKFGCDIKIMYDKDAAPADQYTVALGEQVPLTEQELRYLKYDLSDLVEVESENEIRASFERWVKTMEIDMPLKAKKPKARQQDDFQDAEEPRRKRRPDPEDDFEDDPKPQRKRRQEAEPEDDDGFDEDAPAPKRNGKKRPAQDSFDEDDFGDEEGMDDPKPTRGKKRKPEPDVEFDEDGDGDGDDDGFEDDPKPKRNPKKRPPADDDFGDDDGFDDEPAPKSKRKAAPVDDDDDDFDDPKPTRGKKRQAEPEDDDGFDEDAPAPKRSSKKRQAEADDDGFDDDPKPQRKRRQEPADDDDFDAPAPKRNTKKRQAEPEDDDGFDEDYPAPKRSNKKRQAEPEDDFEDDPKPQRGAKKPSRRQPADDDFDDFN